MKKTLRRLICFFAIGFLATTIASGQSIYSTPYIFTTLAGATNNSTDGNDGTNSSAQFNGPQDVAVDGGGNIYVADTENNTIRKIAHAGTNWIVTTIAGMAQNPGFADGTNLAAQFSNPSAIAVDINSNLYVADAGNNTIRKITPVGTNWVTATIAGSAVESPGFADGTNSGAIFSFPSGITVDTNGNVYVSDTDNSVVRKITPVGTNWVATTIAGSVGNFSGSADGTGTNAQFGATSGITVDANGNLYVVDVLNEAIRKITPVGTNWVVSTIAGQVRSAGFNDGTNLAAQFNFPSAPFVPSGIAADGAGNLYVADTGNSTIRKMTPSGTNWVTTTLAGVVGSTGSADGTGTNVLFNFPSGIAADSAGNLYVADTGNNTIRKGQVAAVPNLAVFLTATNSVVVYWPNPGSYTLQTNADLTTTNWAGYGGAVTTGNGTNSVTISPPAGNLFFRLKQ